MLKHSFVEIRFLRHVPKEEVKLRRSAQGRKKEKLGPKMKLAAATKSVGGGKNEK